MDVLDELLDTFSSLNRRFRMELLSIALAMLAHQEEQQSKSRNSLSIERQEPLRGG